MSLIDIIVRSAKPTTKQYKLSDAKGLYLLVRPNGSKYFRLKYRHNMQWWADYLDEISISTKTLKAVNSV
jgi:Arm DNA-binding domain